MADITKLPTPGVVLDLDAEERPEAEIKPPFTFVAGKREITLADPADVHWRDLAAVQEPGDLLRVSMTREDRRHLVEQNLPTWKFNRLMEKYYEYYDLEDKIREAKRQQHFNSL